MVCGKESREPRLVLLEERNLDEWEFEAHEGWEKCGGCCLRLKVKVIDGRLIVSLKLQLCGNSFQNLPGLS